MISSDSPLLAWRPREAAKALGISTRYLWQLTKDGHVPCVRIGSGTRKTVLYPMAELQAWLAQQATQSQGVSSKPHSTNAPQ
jgi:excisionase family DNA binding protein